jgi:general secretion pathway protein G
MNLNQKTRGFTLIEIMVVVVIIGILAALIAPSVIGRIDQARVTSAKADLKSIEAALELYRLDNFRYPTTDQGLKALVINPNDPTTRNWRAEGYLKQLPKDPWGNPYVYTSPGTNGAPFDLISLGADGQVGGSGADADISLRDLER